MIVVYAHGGGLGHLTRARAALFTLGRTGPVTYLTSSPFAADPRVVGDAAVCPIPLALARDPFGLRAFMHDRLHDLEPTELIVDTFPYGIAGELDRSVVPSGVAVTHLARLLQWPAYTAVAPAPDRPLDFTTTYVVEPLTPTHEHAVASRSGEVVPLVLRDPPADPFVPASRDPAWLVVHAGPPPETRQLVSYAREQAAAEHLDPEIRIVTTSGDPAGDDLARIDVYPAAPLFEHAARIFTAAGFNAMRQLAPHRDRHRFLPFARRFDHQFLRAQRAHGSTDPAVAAWPARLP